MKPILFITVTALVCISNVLLAQHTLTKLWETDSALKVPESVLFDGENKVLYVSNIDGTEPWGKLAGIGTYFLNQYSRMP